MTAETAIKQGLVQRTNLFRRVLWHINRTGFAWGIKAGVTALHLQEKQERRRLAQSLDIGPDIGNLAATFNQDGYAVISNLVDTELLMRLSESGLEKVSRADRLANSQALAHKNFWVRLLDEDMQDGAFASSNIYVRYALQPKVIGMLSVALGELPLLVDVLLTLSRESDAKLSYSQLWHRDYDDVRTIKLFTYLTDVNGPDDGPFTFLPRRESKQFGFSLRSHVGDERVFRNIEKSAVQTMEAPRLTTFIVETSKCLHMGSRMAPGHSRLMYTATFISAPRIYPTPAPRFRADGSATLVERMILGV